MALQERGKIEVVLGPAARKARRTDLNNKMRCWEGHIKELRKKMEIRYK